MSGRQRREEAMRVAEERYQWLSAVFDGACLVLTAMMGWALMLLLSCALS